MHNSRDSEAAIRILYPVIASLAMSVSLNPQLTWLQALPSNVYR